MTASNGDVKQQDAQVKQVAPFHPGLFVIKLIVLLVDIITFPFYYFLQKPWEKLERVQAQRAKLEDPNDPYSAYVRVGKPFTNHYAFKAETIPESQQLTFKLNPKDLPLLGYREIKDVVTEKRSNGKTLMKYDLSDYKWVTNVEVDQTIGDLARGFLSNGVKYREKVLIFAETRMEWFLSAQALFRIGSAVTTLYATLGHKGIVFGINETEVEHIVTTQDLLPILLKLIGEVPKIRKIYVIELHPKQLKSQPVTQEDFKAAVPDRQIELITYNKLKEIGHNTTEEEFDYKRPEPDDIAVILYTSGSTGNPKGVVSTHRNFVSAMKAVYSLLNEDVLDSCNSHTYYGFLPLAHSLEMIAELVFFGSGVKIGYGSTFTMIDRASAIMKGQKGDFTLLKPTIIAGVPLILDRIRKTITDIFDRKSIFKKQLFKYFCAYKNFWLEKGFDTPLVNRFICKPLKNKFGGGLEYILIGGAPLSPDTQRIMRAFLNVKLLIGYGATETCGASCITDFDDMSIGRIGAPLNGVKVRLVDWPEGGYYVTDKPRPRGELVIGGNAISKEYFKLNQQTEEAYEEKDGVRWFKMGDIGEIYEDGTVKIIDRKKDLVKLQFGEYISLGKVEAELKSCKYVENICVYGDSLHTYTIAFISASLPALKELGKDLNKTDLSFEALCNDEQINAAVMKELKEFSEESGLNKMEVPQKIKLCHEEWSVKSGFLTASMKINRKNIHKFYQEYIDKFYA